MTTTERPNLSKQFVLRAGHLARQRGTQYLFLAVAGFLVHLPALNGTLIWDDNYLAHDNPFIKSPLLVLEAFRHNLFLDSFSAHYRPVQNISFMVDYYFWNSETCGFHLTNILLHLASGLLLYRLLTLLTRGLEGPDSAPTRFVSVAPFFIAALWMVHPVHSAAVDYISGRADSLAFAFACGGWLLLLRARKTGSVPLRGLFYFLAILSGFLALCSREIAGVWILIFLLHTLFFGKKLNARNKILTVACTFLLSAAYLFARHLPESRPTPAPEDWGATIRSTLMLRALGDYGRLMLYPSNLHMERTVVVPDHYLNDQGWRQTVASEYLLLLGFGILIILLVGSFKRGSGQRLRLFGASWFFLSYLPTSNIVPLNATVAEHWLYLPSVGFLIFLAGCARALPRKWQYATTVYASLALVGLGWRSWVRSSDWTDELTFYQRTFAAGGVSMRIAGNLALAYYHHGDYAQSEKMLRRVVALAPDYPFGRNNLADLLQRRGHKDEAKALLLESTRQAGEGRKQYPRTWIAAYNLAHLQAHEHREAEAIATLDRARLDYPDVWELIRFESELLRRTRGPEAALKLVDGYLQPHWWHQEANLAAGKLYTENNEVEPALQMLRRAAQLDVHGTEALNLEAKICARAQRPEEAFRAQERAVARQPYEPSQYLLLSDLCQTIGRPEEARNALAQVSRLQALAQAHPEAATPN